MRRLLLVLTVVTGASCKDVLPGGSDDPEPGDATPPPPAWHFSTVEHGVTGVTLTDVWGRSDGAVIAVGWHGAIITNRVGPNNPNGTWIRMTSPTREHLTAIYGVENGGAFGLPGADGEMLAVGWNGTLLHYHPDPDANPTTDNGAWSAVSAPGFPSFAPVAKVDPACPDFDGDGIPDDGNATAWIGDLPCAAGDTTQCDDNCRGAPNGNQRPIVNGPGQTNDSCIGPGDIADPNAANWQADGDADGVGNTCDDEPEVARPPVRFAATLFDVWMGATTAGEIIAVAVGEDGAVVTYRGPSAAVPVVLPALPITNPDAWLAQESVAYYYERDCYGGGLGAGNTCPGSRWVPPTCPAMCHPRKTDCNCPPDSFQCCEMGTGLTGTGCTDASGCPPAENACQANGDCRALCPDCFRRMDRTLRSVAASGNYFVAVGAQATVLLLDLTNPDVERGVWMHPECTPMPAPFDDRPVLAGVSASAGTFHGVGAAGALARLNTAGGGVCAFEPRTGAPLGFLSGVFTTGPETAWVVGDRGLLLDVNGGRDPQVEVVDVGTEDNLLSIWVTFPQMWMVGASGRMVRGDYY